VLIEGSTPSLGTMITNNLRNFRGQYGQNSDQKSHAGSGALYIVGEPLAELIPIAFRGSSFFSIHIWW